jgi:hypothetical protein
MKNAVKFITLFLVMGLLFTIAACKQDDPIPTEEPTPTVDPTPVIEDFNALGGWADDGDSVYTITTNTTAELEFSYAKGTFPNASMSSAAITGDLSVYNKLVITVEGAGTMLLRLETSDTTPTREVGLNVTGIQGTYEWNLMNAASFLEKVNKITIIAAPGKEESIGVISITELMFKETVADGYIINDGFNNIPTNVNEYNGTDEIFNFNDKWENFAEETYTIVKDGDVFNVDFAKDAGYEWSAMQSKVQGTFTDFNYVVVKVSGTAGQPIIVKAADGVETRIILSGEIQEVVVDISEMPVAQKNAIQAILVFGNAGRTGSGSFTIHEAFMIDDYDYEAPVFVTNTYNGIDSEFAVGHWFDGGDVVYTITETDTEYHVVYSKLDGGLEYANMQALIEGNFSNFAKIEFEITGQNAKSVLLKVEGTEGAKEVPVTFDGTRQIIVFDLMTMTSTQLDALNKLVIFAAPGGIGAGEFTLHSVKFMTSDYDVNAMWEENDADTYDFTFGETTVVTYTKIAGQEWAFMKAMFDETEVAGLNTLTMVIKGETGKQILVKPNDSGALEQSVTFDNTDPVTLTFTAEAFASIILFAEPNVAPATGTFEIVSAVLSFVEEEVDVTQVFDFNNEWLANVDTIYDIDFQVDKTVVSYDKLAGNEWEWMRVVFDAQSIPGLNTMTLVLTGEVGKQVLIKPNDSGALEQFVTFEDANPVEITVHADAFTSVYIFGSPGVAPATGTFEIHEAKLYYSVNVTEDWEEADLDTYDVVVGETVVINYTKIAGQEWVFVRNTFSPASTEGLNTYTIVMMGEAGKQVLVKVNNSIEQWVTFEADTPAVVQIMADNITEVIIFAEGGTAPATGTFEILSALITYMTPPPVDIEVEYDFTIDGWEDNDGGIYTFTDTAGVNVVTYDKVAGQEWAFIKNMFADDLSNHNAIEMIVKGDVGVQLIIKPNDNGAYEQTVDLDGTEQTVVFNDIMNPTWILIFVDPINGSLTGSFEIISAKVIYIEPGLEVETDWVDNDGGIYTITDNNGVAEIDYTKTAGQEWAYIKNEFVGDFSMYNTITMVVMGEVGKQLIIKPNDNGLYEQTINFDGTEQTVVFNDIMNPTWILIFVDPINGSLTGSFEIISTKLSYIEPAPVDTEIDVNFTVGDWVDNDGGTYTFTDTAGVNVIDYNKSSEQSYAFIKYTFEENLANHNTVTFVVKGEVGKQLLIKPNDSGLLEELVTFDGTEQTIVINLDTTILNVLIFAEPGQVSVTGTFELISAIVSYEE